MCMSSSADTFLEFSLPRPKQRVYLAAGDTVQGRSGSEAGRPAQDSCWSNSPPTSAIGWLLVLPIAEQISYTRLPCNSNNFKISRAQTMTLCFTLKAFVLLLENF